MNAEGANGRIRQLEEYLDGLLDRTAGEVFERELDSKPELRQAVELQRRVNESLCSQFEPPSPQSFVAYIEARAAAEAGRESPQVSRRSFARQALAVAAAVAIVAVAGWRLGSFYFGIGNGPKYKDKPWQSLTEIYQTSIDAGFEAEWVCDTDKEFAGFIERRLRQPLILAQTPPGVTGVGLSYCNSISTRTMFLLARARDREVIVFIDRTENDKGQRLPDDSLLHLFSRTIGDLVLYELTPLDQPYLLESFKQP